MRSLADEFYGLGFHVIIPLLPAHGLIEPDMMHGAKLDKWVTEVDISVAEARAVAKTVSIGGLSLGGTLAVFKAIMDPESINGALFLFSAALDLVGTRGDISERLMRIDPLVNAVARRQDRKSPDLIGANPFRYARMDFDGARELAHLIGLVEDHYKGKKRYEGIDRPTFIAHSESDPTASLQEMEKFARNHVDPDHLITFYRIAESLSVRHASVVLKDDILDPEDGKTILEPANVDYENMVISMRQFIASHLHHLPSGPA